MLLTLETSLLALTHCIFALPRPNPSPASTTGRLVILDTGVGHRSTPVPRWNTQLRRLSTAGTNATSIQTFGPAVNAPTWAEPIYGYQLALLPSIDSLFLVTSKGIISTRTDGSNPKTIIANVTDLHSVSVAENSGKIYYGTMYDGLIRSADFDGSNRQIVRNVSQGINWANPPWLSTAHSYPDGILVDEDAGLIYWSASGGDTGGSIRRAPLVHASSGAVLAHEVLVTNISMPGQLRILNGWLYWVEKGRWDTSPTFIKRAKLTASTSTSGLSSGTASSKPLTTETLVSSEQSNIFASGDGTMSIQSFTFDASGEKMWFVCQSSTRTMFGKLVEVSSDGTGGLKVLNSDTKDVGVPTGIEYVV